MPRDLTILLVALAFVAVLTGASHPTVRRSLVNGAACLHRHPDAWRIPAFFGLAYGLFNAAAVILLFLRSGESLTGWLNEFTVDRLPPALDLVARSWRMALDTLGSTFHTFTLTFPISAFFALRFLFNVDGVFGALRRSLLRRLPRLGGWLFLGLALSAISAAAKPFVFLLLPELTDVFPQNWVVVGGAAVNFSAVAFELLLGFFLLTYFLLIAHLWLRGSHLDHHDLIHLTSRRLGRVSKWALIYLLLAILLILLPRWIASTANLPPSVAAAIHTFLDDWTQPIFAAILIATALIPISLVFHNLSLPQACGHSFRQVRRHFLPLLLFFAFAAVANLILAIGSSLLSATFGYDVIATLTGRCILAVAQGVLAGWLVVSWACLYKSPIRPGVRAFADDDPLPS